MKHLIRSMIPNRMIPLAQKLHLKWFNESPKVAFSREEYNALPALKCRVSYNKYGGYCVPESSRHRPAAQKILSKDVWEPKTIEYMISNNGNGDIVHAGTYFGDFLPALSKASGIDSKVYAFEPNYENFRCATITLEINNISNVVLTHAGLGAAQDNSLITTVDENGLFLGGASRIIDKEANDENGIETVSIVTVDEMVGADRPVSIIQLDVEGYEKEALKGALKTVQRCLPIIILEVRPNSALLNSKWFAENILNLGYCKVADIHENAVFKYGR